HRPRRQSRTPRHLRQHRPHRPIALQMKQCCRLHQNRRPNRRSYPRHPRRHATPPPAPAPPPPPPPPPEKAGGPLPPLPVVASVPPGAPGADVVLPPEPPAANAGVAQVAPEMERLRSARWPARSSALVIKRDSSKAPLCR